MVKLKGEKNAEMPKTLSVNQILSDLETLQRCNDPLPLHAAKENSDTSLDSWWKLFETFMSSTKCLQLLHKEILDFEGKLQSEKSKLEAEIQQLNEEFDEQQNLLNNVIEINTPV